jgi:hypothetical protein
VPMNYEHLECPMNRRKQKEIDPPSPTSAWIGLNGIGEFETCVHECDDHVPTRSCWQMLTAAPTEAPR